VIAAAVRRFDLQIALPIEQRYAVRGVPGVELRASGPSGVVHRVHGVVDSGASRTLLTGRTAELLGFRQSIPARLERIAAAGGTIDLERARVQFRIPLEGKPAVGFVLEAGISSQVTENLFGSDLLQYFHIVLGPRSVIFMADEVFVGGSDSV